MDELLAKFPFESALSAQKDNRAVHISEAFKNQIVSIYDIERTISFGRIVLNNLSMSRNEKPLDIRSYSDGVFIDPILVASEFSSGASIVIRAAHKFFPSIAKVVSDFGRLWGCEAQGNLYLSKAGVNATYPHFDPHELFIFQISGEKNWDLFEGDYVHPESDDGFDSARHPVGKFSETIHLKAGDVLFLPRGKIHRPIAVSGSIHLAVGLKGESVSQILRKCIHVLSSLDVDLRKLAVPGRSREETMREVVSAARLVLDLLSDDALCQQLINGVLDRGQSDRQLVPGWLCGAFRDAGAGD